MAVFNHNRQRPEKCSDAGKIVTEGAQVTVRLVKNCPPKTEDRFYRLSILFRVLTEFLHGAGERITIAAAISRSLISEKSEALREDVS